MPRTLRLLLVVAAIVSTSPAQVVGSSLIHYWNFNKTSEEDPLRLLQPTRTIGGAELIVTAPTPAEFKDGNKNEFEGLNARLGDKAKDHLRINNPVTPGTTVRLDIPTTGFSGIVVKYETRRSEKGTAIQRIEYTSNGTVWTHFTNLPVIAGTPQLKTLNFSSIGGANNNPNFALRITFQKGVGGEAGNNRIDNITVEGSSLPIAENTLIHRSDSDWGIASNWTTGTVPATAGASAVLLEPYGGNRDVEIAENTTVGSIVFRNGNSTDRNRISGIDGVTLTFDGAGGEAALAVEGFGTGFAELDVENISLVGDLRIDVANVEGDNDYGGLRLRRTWSGSGGVIKDGLGLAAFTGADKNFTGSIQIVQGVLQFTAPGAPSESSGLEVLPGGQLRLSSGSGAGEEDEEGAGERVYSFGGNIRLAGEGRSSEIPDNSHKGVLGALRYDPPPGGYHLAQVTNDVELTAFTDIHVDGTGNILTLSGTISGSYEMIKTGGGTLALTGNSPDYIGPVTVANGPLIIDGIFPQTNVHVQNNRVLSGSGFVGNISGQGILEPGTGTMTAESSTIDKANFLFTGTEAADNSRLLLTGESPMTTAPQKVNFFVDAGELKIGDRLQGGFFTENGLPNLSGSTVRILLPDPMGAVSWHDKNWREATEADNLSWSVVAAELETDSGSFIGQSIEILKGGIVSNYDDWRALNFADIGDREDEGISGPAADPLGSGINNLLRYAAGLSANETSFSPLTVLEGAPANAVFRFRQNSDATDLRWLVKSSRDLQSWDTILESSDSGFPSNEEGWVEVHIPTFSEPAESKQRLFFRLEVELEKD